MPTSDIKEDWTKRRLTRAPEGYRGQLGYTVSFTTDEDDARDKMEAAGFVTNAPHPRNSIMLLKNMDVDASSLNLSKVTIYYEQSGSLFPDGSDPLAAPPRIRYRGGLENVPADRDVFGYPIVNSVGDPYSGVYRDRSRHFFTIIVNQPFYTISQNILYAGKFNSQPWNPLGIGSLARGQAKCLGILPTGDVVSDATYVETAFDFEIGAGTDAVDFSSIGGLSGTWDGFQTRLLDVGSQGWSSSTETGKFVDKSKNDANDVRLDGTGKPIITTIKIMDRMTGKLSDPVATPSASRAKGQVISVSNPSAKFLVYQTINSADFNDFGF